MQCESAQRTGPQLRAPAQTCPDGNTCQARLATLPSSDGRRACRAARNDPATREDGARQLQGLVGQRERSRHPGSQEQRSRSPPLRMERRDDLGRRRRRQPEARRKRHPKFRPTSLGPPPPSRSPPSRPGTTRASRAGRHDASKRTTTSPERDPNPETRTALQQETRMQMQCESAQRTGVQLRAPAQTFPDGTTCQARLATLPLFDGRRACRGRGTTLPADRTAHASCRALLGSESDRVIRDRRNKSSGHRLSGWNDAMISGGGDAASRKPDAGVARRHDLAVSGRRHLPGRRVEDPARRHPAEPAGTASTNSRRPRPGAIRTPKPEQRCCSARQCRCSASPPN